MTFSRKGQPELITEKQAFIRDDAKEVLCPKCNEKLGFFYKGTGFRVNADRAIDIIPESIIRCSCGGFVTYEFLSQIKN